MSRPRQDLVLNLVLALIVAIILLVTLVPARSSTIDFRSPCLICGSRGLADALLNVMLFVPLGLALGARFRSRVGGYVLALALSIAIEAAQTVIPGRDSSISDVVFNGLGAVIGVGLARSWRHWIDPSPRVAGYLAWLAAVMAVSVIAATDALLRPAFPSMQYDAAFTPRLRGVPHYRGAVLEATVGEIQTPAGFLNDSDGVRTGLLAGKPFRARVVTGPPPDGTAPVVGINGFQLEIVSLNLDGYDLIFRRRTRALTLLLDQPELVFERALAGVRPGRIVTLSAERVGEEYCLSAGDLRRCGLGSTVGDGWSILLWSPRIPAGGVLFTGLVWLAAIALPIAFWSPTTRHLVAGGAAMLLALTVVPLLGPLLSTPWFQYASVGVGLGIGRGLRSLVGRSVG